VDWATLDGLLWTKNMNSEQTAKIESALATCLEECRATDRPYTRVSEYIAGLQGDPEWTLEEIAELQRGLSACCSIETGDRAKAARGNAIPLSVVPLHPQPCGGIAAHPLGQDERRNMGTANVARLFSSLPFHRRLGR
jgi:hypothetical protein